jgi:hypothetical protein
MRVFIEKYQAWKLKPIPLKPREKLPKLKGWQTEDQVDKFTDGDNIGCVLGQCVDVDCDWPDVSRYVQFLASTEAIFGRASNPVSHLIYSAPGTKSFKFTCPKSLQQRITLPDQHATCIVELRSGAAYTMFPGSIHPCGEAIEFTEHSGHTFDSHPTPYDAVELRQRVGIAAMMVLLEKTWPGEGARHDAAGAVAGVLRKYGDLTHEECQTVMAPHIQDGEHKERERYITDTYNRPIERISGWNRLKQVFGFESDVIAAFKSWLATPKAPDGGEGSLNADHAVIRDGSKVRIGIRCHDAAFGRETWDLLTESDFLLLHHKGAEARNWLRSPERLTYRDGFVFDPSGKEHLTALNLWRGFAIEPQEGEWKTIEYHIHHVLAGGNQECRDYIVNWLAWLYQNPSKPAEVAIIFRGGRGTGKGILCRAITRSLGQHGIQISSPSLMTGRFNAHFRDCIGLYADEAFWAGDKSGEGQLKRIITEDTLVVEAKGRDAVVVRNMLHIMISSNEDWVVPSGTDERRFAVFDVSDVHKQDNAYFEKVAAAFEGAEMQAFLHHCLTVDLKGWHPRKDVPRTGALQDQIELSEHAEKAILRQCLEYGVLPGTHAADRFAGSDTLLFPRFRSAVRHHAFGKNVSDKVMGSVLKKVALRWDNNGKLFIGLGQDNQPRYTRAQQYIFPPLADARQRFDPHATWPVTPAKWEFERGADEEMTPYQDDGDAPF